MDKEKIEAAVRLFLEGIGEDPGREGLLETPERVSRMCEELFGGMKEDPAAILSRTFTSQDRDLVLVRDIGFYSVCEHHLLPFFGNVHIAYYPNGTVAGLSKLARCVDVFARRPQIQEQMTVQIADALETCLDAAGVLVAVEAEHMCMTMRGVRKPGCRTQTLQVRGIFRERPELTDRVLAMIRGTGSRV